MYSQGSDFRKIPLILSSWHPRRPCPGASFPWGLQYVCLKSSIYKARCFPPEKEDSHFMGNPTVVITFIDDHRKSPCLCSYYKERSVCLFTTAVLFKRGQTACTQWGAHLQVKHDYERTSGNDIMFFNTPAGLFTFSDTDRYAWWIGTHGIGHDFTWKVLFMSSTADSHFVYYSGFYYLAICG